MLALPCIAIITAIALRFNAKTLFERVNGSGKVIDLRLDVENNFSHSSDEYDDATDEIHNAIFFLHTPGSQRPETLRSPDTRLVPIHVPGKCSEDNPFRRISMVSPVSSPLLIAGDRHMAPPVGSE